LDRCVAAVGGLRKKIKAGRKEEKKKRDNTVGDLRRAEKSEKTPG